MRNAGQDGLARGAEAIDDFDAEPMLFRRLGTADLDVLATQLTAALDGPLLLYLSSAILAQPAPQISGRLGRGWEDLIQRVCRP